jgi:hypothetical protein
MYTIGIRSTKNLWIFFTNGSVYRSSNRNGIGPLYVILGLHLQNFDVNIYVLLVKFYRIIISFEKNFRLNCRADRFTLLGERVIKYNI